MFFVCVLEIKIVYLTTYPELTVLYELLMNECIFCTFVFLKIIFNLYDFMIL